ncbi:MAG: GLUG motif-containing protein [Fibrobacterota bacterium]
MNLFRSFLRSFLMIKSGVIPLSVLLLVSVCLFAVKGGDTVLIGSARELQQMQGNPAGHYALKCSFSAEESQHWNGGDGFIPICGDTSDAPGFQGAVFTGSFDGRGHTISGLYINSNRSYTGLFGIVRTDHALKNVTLKDVWVSGGGKSGALVGALLKGHIVDAAVTGTVKGGSNIGGISGSVSSFGLVERSCFRGEVLAQGENCGGIAGQVQGDILRCRSDVRVNAVGEGAGGIAGLVRKSGIVTGCYSRGSVKSDDEDVGGIAGENLGGIAWCGTECTVQGGEYSEDAGGFVGENAYGSIENAYSRGDVRGFSYTGGFVGENDSAVIRWSYSTGAVGVVSAEGHHYGGFVGGVRKYSVAGECFWDSASAGISHRGSGQGIESACLKDPACFIPRAGGWNFDASSQEFFWFFPDSGGPPLIKDARDVHPFDSLRCP